MEFTYKHLRTLEEASQLVLELNAENHPVVLDLETTGLDTRTCSIISAQLCSAGAHTAYYLEKECIDALRSLTSPLVLFNFKYDYAVLLHRREGFGSVDLRKCAVSGTPRQMADVMLLHHLVDENAEHSLDSIVKEHFNDNYKEVFWAANESFEAAADADRIEYACKDAIYTGLLYKRLLDALAVQGVPLALVDHVHKLASALYDTEVRGVRVDLDYLVAAGTKLKDRINTAIPRMRGLVANELAALEADLWLERIEKAQAKLKTEKGKASTAQRIKHQPLNWNSGDQLKRLMYGELKLPEQSKWDPKKKERRPTLDDKALEFLSLLHPLPAELQAHRKDVKVYGSFIEGTLEKQVGGVVYPSFHVNGTVTGRISSSEPNLQQLPRAGGVRGIYVPSFGNKFISCDYGMLEVVIAAHYSQDANLLKIIHEGASKHDITAAALGIDRQKAKTLNFAMQYQCSPFKVAAILDCSKKDGQYAWNKYWEAYSGEKVIVEQCKSLVDRGQPIVGLYGRRRRFPGVFATEKDRARAHRQAYSSLIQGSGSDLVHQAFYSFAHYMERSGHGRAVLEIHDEILGEAIAGKAQESLEEMSRIMVDIGRQIGLSVPLTVGPSGPMDRWED